MGIGSAAAGIDAALGMRVRSGMATAVLLAGPVLSPRVVRRMMVSLSDPSLPETKQPYHASMGTLEKDPNTIQRRTEVVRRATHRSITELLRDCRAAGYEARSAGLVVGSLVEPGTIRHEHMRAHAFEGWVFRTVVEDELKVQHLSCRAIVERDAYAEAASVLGKPVGDLKRTATDMGRALGRPWRAEEKLATLAAWVALASFDTDRSGLHPLPPPSSPR